MIVIIVYLLLLVLDNINDILGKMYEPLHYPQCIHLPARLPNKTKTTMPMMTCYDKHKDDTHLLELLRRKESLILNQFREHRYNNALDIIQLLYNKSDITNIQHQKNNNKMKDGNNQSQVEQLNVVFIGDSMSKQSYFAFICELEYFGAIPINVINNNTAKHFIQSHKNYKDLIDYDHSVIYNINNNLFENKYHINLTLFKHNNDTTRILLHTLFIWRNKGGSGSLLNDVNDNEYVNHKKLQHLSNTVNSNKIIQPFLSLLTKYFNLRTLVLFNEGLHHHIPETLHQSLQFPLTIFQSLSQRHSSNNNNNNNNNNSNKGIPYIFKYLMMMIKLLIK